MPKDEISPTPTCAVISTTSSPTLNGDLGLNNRQSSANIDGRDKTKLKRDLPAWQILMIGIGGVIGITIFSTSGEILHTAGPLGLLVAFCFIAVTTICVMECVAELIVLWPVSNAVIEFVKVFVDRDLGLTMGIGYWYTMSSVFTILIITASDYAAFWLPDVWRILIFYAFTPLVLLGMNGVGVKVYGWIEGIGGIIKILVVFAGILFMIVDASVSRQPSGLEIASQPLNLTNPSNITNPIEDGFQHNSDEAHSDFVAICICIPILSFGFIGTEIVAVTAFEARDRASLRFPVRWVAYIISAMYFASILLQINLVKWDDCHLQDFNGNRPGCSTNTSSSLKRDIGPFDSEYPAGPGWWSIMGTAAWYYNKPASWFFNGCIIYFCLSAANTALYVASRTLFGLTRGLNRMRKCPPYLKPFRYLGQTSPRATIPHFSLIVSALAFCWLPFVRGHSNVFPIMTTTGAIGGIVVWMSLCVAYIRYYYWFRKLKKRGILPPELDRWNPQPDIYSWHKYPTLLASLRLIPACLGLMGCFLIVFVFSTASFWNEPLTAVGFVTVYGTQIVLLLIFVVLKICNQRKWVRLDFSSEALFEVTTYLEENSGIALIPSESSAVETPG